MYSSFLNKDQIYDILYNTIIYEYRNNNRKTECCSWYWHDYVDSKLGKKNIKIEKLNNSFGIYLAIKKQKSRNKIGFELVKDIFILIDGGICV